MVRSGYLLMAPASTYWMGSAPAGAAHENTGARRPNMLKTSRRMRRFSHIVSPQNPVIREIAEILDSGYALPMTTLLEIEKTAMLLPDNERAQLASKLLCSLPAVLHDDDEGCAEAERRDAALDRDPAAGMSMSEFKVAFEG